MTSHSCGGCDATWTGLRMAGRGLCMKCYQQAWRTGTLSDYPLARKPASDEATRFWSKVNKTDECWIWTGGKNAQGYGRFVPKGGGVVYAHRWAYNSIIGPIPSGLTLDHLCRTPLCVNPAHMEVVTLGENARRAHAARIPRMECAKGHRDWAWFRRPDGSPTRLCRACKREYDRTHPRRRKRAA